MPRLCIDNENVFNSMGLPNLEHEYYSQFKYNNKPFIFSVYPPQDINDLSKLFDTNKTIIEVNNYELYFDKIKQIKKDKIVGVKLSPIFD